MSSACIPQERKIKGKAKLTRGNSLICNTENRLGRGGAGEIKTHNFFRGVEFDSLRRIRAPFEPRLTSALDTTYFPTDEIDQTDNATLLKAAQAQREAAGVPQQDESPEMSLPFLGYTFKRFDNNNFR
jgi:protein-serine/threonine kinase